MRRHPHQALPAVRAVAVAVVVAVVAALRHRLNRRRVFRMAP